MHCCFVTIFYILRSERETHLCPPGDSNSQSVINHNPLPDIPHEEFVSLLGPLLVPEHYPSPESPLASPPLSSPPPSPIISAPFDWIHFEGRSVKTTLNNLQGLDGLARERRWRSQCVFSVDVGRRAKQGIEAVRTFLILFTYFPPDELVHTCAANPPCRRSLPQPTLCPSTITRICQRTSCLLARAHASRAAPRPARRLLGRRWRRSALSPNAGVLPVLWVVCTVHSRSRHLQHLNQPRHPTPPSHTQRCSRSSKRAQREWILGRRTRQQSWEQCLLCISAQTAIWSL